MVAPITRTTRVLLLAGTAEATALAGLLADRAGIAVVASFAGRTSAPARLPCEVRTGGFGGTEGLVRTLRAGGFDALVDATHPFAAVIPHHAAAAATAAGVPRVRLVRPPWLPGPGDRWHDVPDLAGAAAALADVGARRVLLTTGRLELAPFADVPDAHFLVRSIEPPDPMPLAPSRSTVVLARGPFTVEDELALLRRHRVDTIVSKNSGGGATVAKLTAARELGIRVVMVRRPPVPPGPVVRSADAARRWLDDHVTRR